MNPMRRLLLLMALCGALSAQGQKRVSRPRLQQPNGLSVVAQYDVQRGLPDSLSPAPEVAKPYTLMASGESMAFAPTPDEGKPFAVSGPMAVYIDKREKLSAAPLLMEYVLVRDAVSPIRWTIIGERKIVNGHPCQKATAGDTVAWFCEAIPLPAGPLGCYGLPGLIMELSTPRLRCIATSVQQSRLPVPVARPRSFPVYSREQYARILKEGGKLRLKNPRPADVMPQHH